jgi:hypothetical protein
MSTPSNAPEPALGQPQAKDFREAFERVEAEIHAVLERDLVAVNLDVTSAVATALGALPEILTFREQLLALKDIDVTSLEKLRDYAFALLHAHTVYRGSPAPTDSIRDVAAQLLTLRDQLFSDAQALGKRKLLDLARVEKCRSGLGFKNLALDVNGLVQILRDNRDAIAGKTAVTGEELDHAAELAGMLIVGVGVKEQAPTGVSAVALTRQRAFTLFTRAYDELRRGITFLRWHSGDIDNIAPSLYAGRGGRKPVETHPPAPIGPAGLESAGEGTHLTMSGASPRSYPGPSAPMNGPSDVETLPGIGVPTVTPSH